MRLYVCGNFRYVQEMKTGRIIYPVYTLGPGKRVGIWLSGCKRKCEGCGNPELWDSGYGKDLSVAVIMEIIREFAFADRIDGFTISGGEPFLQEEELALLLSMLSEISEDILVYTGYKAEEITADMSNIAVLIDGEYIHSLCDGHILKGSSNQRIHYLKEEYRKPYEQYIRENSDKNFVQTVPFGKGMLFLGIQGDRLRKKLKEKLNSKGIEER